MGAVHQPSISGGLSGNTRLTWMLPVMMLMKTYDSTVEQINAGVTPFV